MKASLKFRDERKPLLRAKVPISVLGFPFLAGAAAGEAKDLCLDIATAFVSGPSFRVSYRPNDSWCPFALVVKTGVGTLGSPTASPMTMSAEFNIVGRGGPSFVIQLKPQLGDFCLKKATRSAAPSSPPFATGSSSVINLNAAGEGSGDCADPPGVKFLPENGLFTSKVPNGVSTLIPSATGGGIQGLLSGVELTARSALPIWNRTTGKFHWGLRMPSDLHSSFTNGYGSFNSIGRYSYPKLPTLVMNKISIELKSGEEKPREKTSDEADARAAVQRQLASLQAESAILRKAVEDLRADFFSAKPSPISPSAGYGTSSRPETRERRTWEAADRAAARSPSLSRNGNEAGRKGEVKAAEATKDDVSEELRKALMGATGGL